MQKMTISMLFSLFFSSFFIENEKKMTIRCRRRQFFLEKASEMTKRFISDAFCEFDYFFQKEIASQRGEISDFDAIFP